MFCLSFQPDSTIPMVFTVVTVLMVIVALFKGTLDDLGMQIEDGEQKRIDDVREMKRLIKQVENSIGYLEDD